MVALELVSLEIFELSFINLLRVALKWRPGRAYFSLA